MLHSVGAASSNSPCQSHVISHEGTCSPDINLHALLSVLSLQSAQSRTLPMTAYARARATPFILFICHCDAFFDLYDVTPIT